MSKQKMFKLMNLYNKAGLSIMVTYKDQSAEFLINNIISKRNKDDLNEDLQFELLNSYVDYKGEVFKEELFKRYLQVMAEIMININSQDIHPLPLSPFHNILDMFDPDDIYHFINNVYHIQVPPVFQEEFDPLYEKDGRGSRVQTYIKTDYLKLVCLVVAVKAVIGPIGHYAHIKNKQLDADYKEYILFEFIKTHKVGKLEAVEKILGGIEKLMQMPDIANADTEAVRTIEKKMPKEMYPQYLLAVVVIQKVSMAVIIKDNDDENIVTSNYHYVKNKLRPNTDASKTIKNTVALSSQDNEEDKDSILEAVRSTSDVPPGERVELNWAVSDIGRIRNSLPIELNDDLVKDSIKFTKVFLESDIDNTQIQLLGIIFKNLIDPRGMVYLKTENLVNLLGIGFAYLWTLGFKHIAILLVSIKDNEMDSAMDINLTVNKNRIPKEIKDEIAELFPYNRVVNAEKSVNVTEDMINTLGNIIFSNNYILIAPNKFTEEVISEANISRFIPPNLKILLAEFIIKHERLIHEN